MRHPHQKGWHLSKEEREKRRQATKEYWRLHPEEKDKIRNILKNVARPKGKKHWRWSGGRRTAIKRDRARRRTFGFEPINPEFEGSEGHHIDRQHVIFIPKDMHRSVWHSLDKPETMEQINTKVFCWLLGKI